MIDYCNTYHCPGDCGMPHNQEEMTDHMKADKLKAKIGRPVNQEFQRTKIRTVRLTDDDWKKLKELGTDRLRAWLRKAKP